MNQNERLRQILDKLAEVEALAHDCNLHECDPDQTAEIDEKAWHLYLHYLRQPGTHRTDQRRVVRAYECLDEGYIDLLGLKKSTNAYTVFHDVARRIALLLPKLSGVLTTLNIYPMEESDIADRYYWKNQEEDKP